MRIWKENWRKIYQNPIRRSILILIRGLIPIQFFCLTPFTPTYSFPFLVINPTSGGCQQPLTWSLVHITQFSPKALYNPAPSSLPYFCCCCFHHQSTPNWSQKNSWMKNLYPYPSYLFSSSVSWCLPTIHLFLPHSPPHTIPGTIFLSPGPLHLHRYYHLWERVSRLLTVG